MTTMKTQPRPTRTCPPSPVSAFLRLGTQSALWPLTVGASAQLCLSNGGGSSGQSAASPDGGSLGAAACPMGEAVVVTVLAEGLMERWARPRGRTEVWVRVGRRGEVGDAGLGAGGWGQLCKEAIPGRKPG